MRLARPSRRSSAFDRSIPGRCRTASARSRRTWRCSRGSSPWGDLRYAVERGRRAAELERPTSPWRPVTDVASGWCLYLLGENVEADRWFAEATQPALEFEQWRVAVSSWVGRSLVAEALRRTDEQSDLAARAVALLQEQRLEGADTELPIALGATLESRGDLEAALASFEHAVAVHRDSGQPPLLALALIRQAAVLRALDREAEAQAAAEEARTAVDSCPDPGILASWLEDVERPPRTRRPNDDDTLSERELVVLRALTGPLSEREIGRELYLSHNTIHTHTRSIYRKLGVSSRNEAIRRGRELGIL
jgi:LuxR family maltose regulon positive regulatory protein